MSPKAKANRVLVALQTARFGSHFGFGKGGRPHVGRLKLGLEFIGS